jgi:murein DD-endopeptidase MepM/ murein hydrolase activator NlpD
MSAFRRLLKPIRCHATSLVVAFALLLPARAGAVDGPEWVWPLAPRPPVMTLFDPPDSPYGAGNRGVDLVGAVGQTVFAIGEGVVTYAGALAGRGVVVVRHGRLRSTYEPVSPGVAVGDTVVSGDPIGVLSAVGSHCVPDACLHLGVIRGADYVDPMSLLPDAPIRLKPLTGEPVTVAPGVTVASGVEDSTSPTALHDAAVAAASYPWPDVR